MNSAIVLLLGILAMLAGYFFYSKFFAKHILGLDNSIPTPAHSMKDGIDYVPTNKYVLWGHHFTSVAGAAPIIGPAIAVIWGWVPAVLWVVLGTIFMAGIHDMSAVWASMRNKGQSIGSIAGSVMGGRVRTLMMVVIFLLLLMVNAVFGVVIANMMIKTPTAVIPVWGALVVAFIIGQCIYRFKMNLVLVSTVGVIALYALIYIGTLVPVVLPETMFGLPDNAVWIIFLFIYAAVASLLPVWMLLQPRDYINGLQLFVGLILLFGAILVATPDIVAPALNHNLPVDTPSIMPLLFVTIACGAISGFHGLVSTGTTSKQIDKEEDVRFVGYFGAVGEGLLALGAVLATTAGFATLAEWEGIYQKFGDGSIGAFIDGGATILNNGMGIEIVLSQTILTVMAALFAGTTMDTGVRLQRYIFQEFGEVYNLPALKKGVVATLLAVGTCLLIAFGAGGIDGSGGMIIWPLFGTTNQLMAALTLMIVTVILLRKGKTVWYTLAPLTFLLLMAVFALILQLKSFYLEGNWLLIVMDIIILIATIMVTFESFSVLRREWKQHRG
ncbi:carbon starvation CstA family protein [Psychrobacter sanguinis]|uniref:carbon starvation CstA family protein n=1 Tax=Psychrobacter sanguinis TaxID=861445 RepID=UPI00191A866F|nr:carbon starvation protein A [Psychrobacter sanguinis]MCC3307736.1 carbon starvation protein A [Psychrobacter sanguinis]UEC25041.1 carbon starvation protein A [Psychrobacter sanguinis]